MNKFFAILLAIALFLLPLCTLAEDDSGIDLEPGEIDSFSLANEDIPDKVISIAEEEVPDEVISIAEEEVPDEVIIELGTDGTIIYSDEEEAISDEVSIQLGDIDDISEKRVTYYFLNGEDIVNTQTVKNGDALYPFAAPDAPEGWAFAGWYIGDMKLFDDNSQPFIAAVDQDSSDVYVIAVFEEKAGDMPAEQPAMDEPGDTPAEDEPDDEASDTSAGDEPADEPAEQPVGDETEDACAEQPTRDEPTVASNDEPIARELIYNGDAQPLVNGVSEGQFVFSLDGENYDSTIPSAANAGEYIVYFKTGEDLEAKSLTVTIAKADVIFTPPTASTGE